MSTTPTITTELVADEEQTQLLAVVQQNALPPAVAQSLQSSFAPLFASARSILEKSKGIVVTDVSQRLEIKLARECRLALRAVRVDGEKLHKALKDSSRREGLAIDGVKNILLHLTETEETRLKAQEDFAEVQETKRKEALKIQRTEIMVSIQADPNLYNLAEMGDDTFQQLVEGVKLARAAAEARRLKDEADRIAREAADLAERERVRLDNDRLKREADEREAAAKIERERVEKEKAEAAKAAQAELERREALAAEERRKHEEAAAEIRRVAKENADKLAREAAEKLAEQQRIAAVAAEIARKEQARLIAERDAELERLAREQKKADDMRRQEREAYEANQRRMQQEAEAKAAAERLRLQAIVDAEKKKTEAARAAAETEAHRQRVAREKLEQEAKEARDKEIERQRAADEAERKARSAPDKDKLLTYANAIRALEVPTLSTDAAQALCRVVVSQRDKLLAWIEEKSSAL